MRPRPPETPPQFWAPDLKPEWVDLLRPLRILRAGIEHRIAEVEVRGLDNLHNARTENAGVLITPNHPGSADPFVMYRASDHAGIPFYFMAAWQLFGDSPEHVRTLLRWHGVFSVDREGADRNAFREAVTILAERENPLVVFPEGEVYHLNDRVTPFREGAAAIALTAARKSDRPTRIVPAAIRYRYLQDPTPKLIDVMAEIEQHLLWHPRPDLKLPERILRVAEGLLALKELEYIGGTQSGNVRDRIAALSDTILSQLESRHGEPPAGSTIPERVKRMRQIGLRKLNDDGITVAERKQVELDFAHVHVVTQLFSYPGDYMMESPTIERIAETIDKLAEDVIGKSRASVCADRAAEVSFGDAISVPNQGDRKQLAPELTRQMEAAVQLLLDAG